MAYDPRDDERRRINEEERIEEQRRRQNVGYTGGSWFALWWLWLLIILLIVWFAGWGWGGYGGWFGWGPRPAAARYGAPANATPPQNNNTGADNTAGMAGTNTGTNRNAGAAVTNGGQAAGRQMTVENVPALLNSNNKGALAGEQVALSNVKVQKVDNNGAIWVGPSQNQRLLVVQNTPGNSNQNPTKVQQGQQVTVHGTIERVQGQTDMEKQWALPASDAQNAEQTGIYVQAQSVTPTPPQQNR